MNKPTETTYKAAIARLENGNSLGEVIDYFDRNLGVALKKTTLHTKWKKYCSEKNRTAEQKTGIPGTTEQSASTFSESATVEHAQNAHIDTENAVPVRSDRSRNSSKTAGILAFLGRHFGLMDWAFYLLNGTACFAVFDTVPGVPGASMATIYALFSLDAILRVKRADMPNAAQVAAMRVVVLEIIAALFHFRLINSYLWHNLDKLPFEVYYGVEHGRAIARQMDGDTCINCYYHNGSWVGLIAALCAFLMACASCHAVFFAKAAAKERVKGMV